MLPRIELGQPIVVPPSEETVYDSGYIVGMGLGTHAILTIQTNPA